MFRPKRRLVEDVEITEDMIEYVASNPMIMRRWQNLAHQVSREYTIWVYEGYKLWILIFFIAYNLCYM